MSLIILVVGIGGCSHLYRHGIRHWLDHTAWLMMAAITVSLAFIPEWQPWAPFAAIWMAHEYMKTLLKKKR